MKISFLLFSILVKETLQLGCGFCWLKRVSYECGSNRRTYKNSCYRECDDENNFEEGKCPGDESSQEDDEEDALLKVLCKKDKKGSGEEEVEDDDPKVNEYKPVCGDNGKTYLNPLSAKCDKVENFKNGRCKKIKQQCESLCSKEKKPVCKGSKTYKNYCMAFCEGNKGEDVEPCNGNDDDDFRHPDKFKSIEQCCCPMNYNPVCGSDGVMYHNLCHLICNNCTQRVVAVCNGGGIRPWGPGRPGFGPWGPRPLPGGVIPKNPNINGVGYSVKNPNVGGIPAGGDIKNPNIISGGQ